MSMPELPKITLLIAATRCQWGRWGSKWRAMGSSEECVAPGAFFRLLSRAFHYYFFHRSHTKKTETHKTE